MSYTRFAYELREAVSKRGVLLQDLADEVEISRSAMSKLYNGHTVPRYHTAERLAQVLEWPNLIGGINKIRGVRCETCNRETVSLGTRPRKYCSARCAGTARSKRLSAGKYENSFLHRLRLEEYQEAIAAFCKGCEPEGICRDNTCPIQAGGISPLPFIPLLRRTA